MSPQEGSITYLCSRCFSFEDAAGTCPRCGIARIECLPGKADDPHRRPIMNERGQVRSRAPRWWLRHTVGRLLRLINED
jgi:hypothetical protein